MADFYSKSDKVFNVRGFTDIRNEPGRTPKTRYRIRYWHAGGEKGTDSASSEAEAVQKCEAVWKSHLDGMLDAPVLAPETLGQLRDAFLARSELAPATLETYSKVLKRFVDHCGEDRDLTQVGKGAVTRWFAAMDCKPVSQASYLRTLRAMFLWAIKSKFIAVDPTRDQTVERHKTVIRPWLQRHEWDAFLAACGPGHRIRAGFALETGLRAGELADARWSWLRGTVGGMAITVPASKSARDRAIPLSARAKAWIAEARAQWGAGNDGSCSPPDDAKIFGQMDPHNLRRDTVKACKAAGVTTCDFHGLRRSCGARWLEVGVPLLSVSRMLGHADVSTTARHYAGLADSTLAADIARTDAAEADRADVAPVVAIRRHLKAM